MMLMGVILNVTEPRLAPPPPPLLRVALRRDTVPSSTEWHEVRRPRELADLIRRRIGAPHAAELHPHLGVYRTPPCPLVVQISVLGSSGGLVVEFFDAPADLDLLSWSLRVVRELMRPLTDGGSDVEPGA